MDRDTRVVAILSTTFPSDVAASLHDFHRFSSIGERSGDHCSGQAGTDDEEISSCIPSPTLIQM